MESLRLDTNDIHEYQKNRYPYLLIDIAEEVIPGVSSKGYKNLTNNDWFFDCHFQGDPCMPGMLQVEALIQMSSLTVLTLPGNKGKILYLTSANNIKLFRKIVSGDRLDIETKLLSWKRGLGSCSGTSSVNGEIACQAEFSFVLPDVVSKYKISPKP